MKKLHFLWPFLLLALSLFPSALSEPQPQAPPTVAEMRIPRINLTGKTFVLIELAEGHHDLGFDIAWPFGGTGPGRTSIDPKALGVDGVLIRGAGRDLTSVGYSGASSTLLAGNGSGIIVLEDLELQSSGTSHAFHLGTSAGTGTNVYEDTTLTPTTIVWTEFHGQSPNPDAAFILNRVRLVSDKRWVGHGYNFDFDYLNVEIVAPLAQEHHYWHGYAKMGFRAELVRMLGMGSEGFKFTCRPYYKTDTEGENVAEAWWVAEARGYIKGQIFTNWAVSGAGGGIVSQGNGLLTLMIEDVLFLGGDNVLSRCLMFDDGLVQNWPGMPRHYNEFGRPSGGQEPQTGAANGWVHLRNCAFYGSRVGGPPIEILNVIATDPIDGNYPHDVLRGFWVSGCGFYGENSLIGIDFPPSGNVPDVRPGYTVLQGCNTPAIDSVAENAGVNITYETVFKRTGLPVSVDFSDIP